VVRHRRLAPTKASCYSKLKKTTIRTKAAYAKVKVVVEEAVVEAETSGGGDGGGDGGDGGGA